MQSCIRCIGMGTVLSFASNCDQFREALYSLKEGLAIFYEKFTDKYGSQIGRITETFPNKYIDIAERALEEALNDAKLLPEHLADNNRVGFVMGSSLGNMSALEEYYQPLYSLGESGDTNHLLQGELGELRRRFCQKLKIKGPSFTVSNTCASGISAIGLGSQLIQSNLVDICIVGAVEVISDLISNGLESMHAINADGFMNPFSAERKGIVLGEGAGFIVMANNNVCKSVKNYGKISGYSVTNDAQHLSAPDKEGRGLSLSIKQSLKMAEMSVEDIECVFCCATGTKYNDAMQAKVIAETWRCMEPDSKITITSVKPVVGHTLGAAGIIETIAGFIMMNAGWVTPISDSGTVDPEISSIPLQSKFKYQEIETAILLASGFSGVNGSLIIRKDL